MAPRKRRAIPRPASHVQSDPPAPPSDSSARAPRGSPSPRSGCRASPAIGRRQSSARRAVQRKSGERSSAGEHPADVIVDVAGEAQLGARPHHAGKLVEHLVGDEAALALRGASARDRDRGCRRGRKSASGRVGSRSVDVLVPDADIVEPLVLDRGQKLRHAVHERLAADEVDVGVGARLGGQMLAAAEADLEPGLPSRRSGNWLGGRRPRDRAGRGRSVWTSSSWPARRRLPFRRPKKAPAVDRGRPELVGHRRDGSSIESAALRGVGRRGRCAPRRSRHRPAARGRNGHRPRCGHRSAG